MGIPDVGEGRVEGYNCSVDTLCLIMHIFIYPSALYDKKLGMPSRRDGFIVRLGFFIALRSSKCGQLAGLGGC